jgi:hypothetical protein
MKKFFTNSDEFNDDGIHFRGNEKKFEQLLKLNLPKILSNNSLQVFNFSLQMSTLYGGGIKPDLLILNPDYQGYTVVEVETEFHGIRDHVLPQIRRFGECDYSFYANAIFTHLHKVNKNVELDKKRFVEMFQKYDANFLVVSTRYSVEWDDLLAKNNFGFIAAIPYKNDQGQYSFHVKYGNKKDNLEKKDILWQSSCFTLRDRTRSIFKLNRDSQIWIDGKLFKFNVRCKDDNFYLFPFDERFGEMDQFELLDYKVLRYSLSKEYMEITK